MKEYDCGKWDKKICIFIKWDFLTENEISEIKLKYLSDPIKLVVLKDFVIVENLLKENDININDDIILAYKGKVNQFLAETNIKPN